MQAQAASEERPARSAPPSLLTASVGQKVLSRLDDGSGCSSPERVIGLWTEEGLRNSRQILQVSPEPSFRIGVSADKVWIRSVTRTSDVL